MIIDRLKNFWCYSVCDSWWWMLGLAYTVIGLVIIGYIAIILFVVGSLGYILFNPELIGEYIGKIINGFESTK